MLASTPWEESSTAATRTVERLTTTTCYSRRDVRNVATGMEGEEGEV